MRNRAIGGALVLACTLASGLGARKMAKAPIEKSQAFREKGPAAAKITIVEFSDFQCPACRVAQPPLRQILSLYGTDVRFIFKHLPLERIHPYARMAASVAECAGRQGKFWELHDRLYDHQDEWTANQEAAEKLIGVYAKEADLDPTALAACRSDPSVAASIDADGKEAADRWVSSTPTFFINGRRFVGAKQLQERGTRLISKALGK